MDKLQREIREASMNENFRDEIFVAVLERTIRRLWILCIILIILLAGTNAAWIYYESQFEDVVTKESVDQSVDTGDGNAIVNGIGDINGEGAAESNTSHQETSEKDGR